MVRITDRALRDFATRRGRAAIHGNADAYLDGRAAPAGAERTAPSTRARGGDTLEESFERTVRAAGLADGMEREYHFARAAGRMWRFDFAWPRERFAVELEGLTHEGGRHQRLDGFLKDAEKYEAAMLDGWTVYRVPGPWRKRGSWRAETIDAIGTILGRRGVDSGLSRA